MSNKKHIFIVNNNINLIGAYQIATKMPDQNVVFLVFRDALALPDLITKTYKHEKWNEAWKKELNTINISKLLEYKKRVASFVSTYCGKSDFELYIPQSQLLAYRFFNHHKQCIDFNYIEEGVPFYNESYSASKSSSLLIKGIKNIFNSFYKPKRVNWNQAFFNNKFKNSYVFNKEAFSWSERKVVLEKDFSIFFKPVTPKPAYIFSPDGWFNILENNKYFEDVLRLIKSKVSQESVFYFKAHPACVQAIKNSQFDLIQNELKDITKNVYLMESDIFLESLPANYKGLKFFTGVSASALYTNSNNCITYSFYNYLASISPEYKESKKRFYEVIEKDVIDLNK